MRYRLERINGHEYIIGEGGRPYITISGADDEGSPSPLPMCPSHKKELVFLNDPDVVPDIGKNLQPMYCPLVQCNYVYIPKLENEVHDWAAIVAVIVAVRQAASHKKITE